MSPTLQLRTRRDPVSEALCYQVIFFKYQTMDKAQNPSDPECYTQSLELFRANRHYFACVSSP
jgi:hypothetical protein